MEMSNSSLTNYGVLKFGIAMDIFKYIIRSVAAVGILLNLLTVILLFSKKFEHKFYDFLQCRCVCNLIVSLFTVYTSPLQCRGCEDDYTSLFINIFVIQWPTRSAYLASAVSDNLLVLNRLVNLYQSRDSVFNTLSKKVNVLFIKFEMSLFFNELV